MSAMSTGEKEKQIGRTHKIPEHVQSTLRDVSVVTSAPAAYGRKDTDTTPRSEIRRRLMGKNQGIAEQKVWLNAPQGRCVMKRSRGRGWKWQQGEHRHVLHMCLWGGCKNEEQIPCCNGKWGWRHLWKWKEGAEGSIMVLFHFCLLLVMLERLVVFGAKKLPHADLPWQMVTNTSSSEQARGNAFAFESGLSLRQQPKWNEKKARVKLLIKPQKSGWACRFCVLLRKQSI